MAGLYDPLPTLRSPPRGELRTDRGDVGCYSFIAVDFHHILLAGLPAHSLALRPAHSRGHQFVTRYPKASDISSPPCLLRLLPAGAIAGWDLHPLESAALSRRTWKADPRRRTRQRRGSADSKPLSRPRPKR